ncbi:hypothetical protein EV121DRAFT_274947, partial [Schizophyllum commune]
MPLELAYGLQLWPLAVATQCSSFPRQEVSLSTDTIQVCNIDSTQLAMRYHEDCVNADPSAWDGSGDELVELKRIVDDTNFKFFENWKDPEEDKRRQEIASNWYEHRALRQQDKSRARAQKHRLEKATQILSADPGTLDARLLRITSTGWRGINVNRLDEGCIIADLFHNHPDKL